MSAPRDNSGSEASSEKKVRHRIEHMLICKRSGSTAYTRNCALDAQGANRSAISKRQRRPQAPQSHMTSPENNKGTRAMLTAISNSRNDCGSVRLTLLLRTSTSRDVIAKTNSMHATSSFSRESSPQTKNRPNSYQALRMASIYSHLVTKHITETRHMVPH